MSALLHPGPTDVRRALPTAAAAALAVLGSALDDAVFGLGADGRVVLANPAGEQLLVGDQVAAGAAEREPSARPSTSGQP